MFGSGTVAVLTKFLCGFPQLLLTNARTVPRLGNAHIIPNPFQFTVHLLPPYDTVALTLNASLNNPMERGRPYCDEVLWLAFKILKSSIGHNM